MTNDSTLIAISAFSGLAGALLTQIFTGINNYYTDKRKKQSALDALYRDKKLGIGENFYYFTGEKLLIIKKNIRYWKNWNTSRSESSVGYLRKELGELIEYTKKLEEQNWQYNLAAIYFKLSFSPDEILAANDITHKLYIRITDLNDAISNNTGDKDELLAKYAIAVFDLCSAYQTIYDRLEQDQHGVQQQLIREFSI